MKRIILDTNFLLIPFTKKVDIFRELDRIIHVPYKICIIRETIDELEKIRKNARKGRDKDAAKMAIQLINVKNILVLDNEQKDLNRSADSKITVVDDIILKFIEKDMIVATQDKAFKERLINKDVNIIYLRNKKLEIKDVL
jgi:rRNA-processing protein FCF1